MVGDFEETLKRYSKLKPDGDKVAVKSKTSLSKRIKALEDAARGREPCTFEQHRGLLLEILQRRAVPLPPLEGVDLPATADLWAGDGARAAGTL